MDLILTGRPVDAEEALQIGLANRVVEEGTAREAAEELARTLAGFPQACLRADRLSALEQWGKPMDEAIRGEFVHGIAVLASGESREGALRFREGAGRHGAFASPGPGGRRES